MMSDNQTLLQKRILLLQERETIITAELLPSILAMEVDRLRMMRMLDLNGPSRHNHRRDHCHSLRHRAVAFI